MSEPLNSKKEISLKNDPALKMLDILRGLAAFYVMMAHARWILWEGYSSGYILHPEQYNIFDKSIMYLFSAFKYGHLAVIFFFVLSGFVIHLRQANNALVNKSYSLDFGYYLKRRIVRIYPPFIFSLILAFILDSFGKHIFPPIYTGSVDYTLSFLHLNTNFDFSLFIKNLFFIQKDNSELWGSNPVIWSLQMEWWFYLIYPIVLLLNRISFLRMSLLVLIFCTTSIIAFGFYPNIIFKILAYFILWWLGAALSEAYIRNYLQTKIIFSGLVCFAFIPFIFDLGDLYKDLIFSFGVCGIISALFYTYKYHRVSNWPKIFINLGRFSYTLYLIHFSTFMFISAIYMNLNDGKLPVKFYLMILSVGFVLFLSNFLYKIIEKPFFIKTKQSH